jgi:hypothetical protein
MTETYARGTKTHKVNSAHLTTGMRVLTGIAGEGYRKKDGSYGWRPRADGALAPATNKTGSTVRTVASVEPRMVAASGYYRRAARLYVVTFTDGTSVDGAAPVQTWHVLDQ